MNRKYILIYTLFFAVIFTFHNSYSQNAGSKKAYISSMMASGSKLTKKTITLSENEKKEINTFLKISDTPNNVTFINIKSNNGDLQRSITFIQRILPEYNQDHTIGIVINHDGTVHDASLINAVEEYPLMLAIKSFTGQFKGKGLKNTLFQKDINGVTGATESAKVFNDAVRIALKVFKKHLL